MHEKMVMTPPESGAMQDNADSPPDPSLLPSLLLDLLALSPSRPLKGRYKMWPVRKCVASQENYLSFLIHADRNPGNSHGNEY